MSKYILKRELPTFKVGDKFFTDRYGSLYYDQSNSEKSYTNGLMAYHFSTIKKFPNILIDWFEEIKPAEPLIKDPKVRKAVKAWLAIQEQPIVEVALSRTKDSDGFFNYCLYGYIEEARISNGKAVKNKNLTAIDFEFRSLEKIEFEQHRDYTIAELCGEEEEC